MKIGRCKDTKLYYIYKEFQVKKVPFKRFSPIQTAQQTNTKYNYERKK